MPLVGIGTPPKPPPAGQCAPSPLFLGGGEHSLARKGLGESQFRRGAYTVVLFICTYFVKVMIDTEGPLCRLQQSAYIKKVFPSPQVRCQKYKSYGLAISLAYSIREEWGNIFVPIIYICLRGAQRKGGGSAWYFDISKKKYKVFLIQLKCRLISPPA